jgi:hypothetical protein
MSVLEAERWQPQTAADRELVLRELNAVLSSPNFRNSKRYPKLLRYVVTKALSGDPGLVKERTLGIEVFDRAPDYDTNADPIVRVTAGEIRKRLAQHYYENGSDSGLEISLGLGSYLPCFRRYELGPDPKAASVPSQSTDTTSANERESRLLGGKFPGIIQFRTSKTRRGFWLLFCFPVAIAALALGGFLAHREFAPRTSELFWDPLLRSPGPILAVIPTSLHVDDGTRSQDGTKLSSLSHGPYDRISMSDAVALSQLASFLGNHSKKYEVKEANLTALGDLHERSSILVGALNNHWTMSLSAPLRFHFVQGPSSVSIVDRRDPQKGDWIVDYRRPYAFAEHDFAIIARYSDPTTGGNVLIIAGIGAHATQAASEFVATPSELEPLRQIAPYGWQGKNLEMVVRTDVINGESSPAKLVALDTW